MCYEYKLGHSAAEATRNIMQAWGADSVTENTMKSWFVGFCAGNFNLEDKPRGGHPSSIDNGYFRNIFNSKLYNWYEFYKQLPQII